MAEAITIEEYSDRCKEQIIDFILDIQRNEFAIEIKREDQPDLSDVSGFYQKGNGNFWVALDNEDVAGTIALLDIANNQVALRKMFVKAAYRGSGIAKSLLAKSIESARNHKVTEIYLGTTDKFSAAHRFYEKNGFVRISAEDLPEAFPVMKVDTIFYKYVL